MIRMPAEWELHEALWLAMPHDRKEWGHAFAGACQSVMTLASEVAREDGAEQVELLVAEPAPEQPGVRTHRLPYGDIWLRDTGPLFVHAEGALVAASFAFNGWGGKYVFPHDAQVAGRIAETALVPERRHSLVLEGGAVDGNGQGTFLTTRECLLHHNRNPGKGESDIEQVLAESLGATQVIWIDRGLHGDHTDGHVDNLARFVGPARVVCSRAASATDPNAEIYQEVERSLRSAHTARGEKLELVFLPSPGVLRGPDGLMAASYCNFLITNRCVIVPTFDQATDVEALSIFADLFPERRIVGLEACALLTGGGTVHCISQQQPVVPHA